jgi:hypothetical protein
LGAAPPAAKPGVGLISTSKPCMYFVQLAVTSILSNYAFTYVQYIPMYVWW